MKLIATPVHDSAEIESAIAALGRDTGSGLIVLSGLFTFAHRELIVRLADRYRVPAVYPYREFVESGGLLSYGVDLAAQFRQAAPYVDRILKGEKAADLPVQTPTKFELAVNSARAGCTCNIARPRRRGDRMSCHGRRAPASMKLRPLILQGFSDGVSR
jgi:putative ABC transport system substrate-binding protein